MTINRPSDWRGWILVALGVALIVFGARGFYARGQFDIMDVVACGLWLVPAGALLLVITYVLQHATLAAVVPIAAAALLARAFPASAVALGIMLLWLIARSE